MVLEQVLRAMTTADPDRRAGAKHSRETQPRIVIAAFVRAKLFGIKLLTLDARVALAPAEAGSDITTVAAQARSISYLLDRPVPRLPSGRRTDLAYAVRLLEAGSKSLDESRATRRLDVGSPE